jgi:hypothetical protein
MPRGIYPRTEFHGQVMKLARARKRNDGRFVAGQAPHNKGVQLPEVLEKVATYKRGEPVECVRHGLHMRYQFSAGRNSIYCKFCISETQKKLRQDRPFKAMLRDARARKIGFDLDEDFLIKMYESQQGRCALSGIPFDSDHKPSIDRVDSLRGYLRDNVQLVTLEVNRMKTNLSQELFLELCNAVAAEWNRRHLNVNAA